jgi:RNA polymerase sigma-70 factor (ECF subfamily)
MTCCCADWIGGLARSHAGTLAAIARREGVTATDALDVVQDAFQRLLGRPDLREDAEAARRALAAMVRNGARNLRRRHHRALPHEDIELTSSAPNPAESLDHAAEVAQLAGCMAALADSHRHVVTLRVLEELSGDETARELGLTSGHVAVLLHRARAALAACMGTVSIS